MGLRHQYDHKFWPRPLVPLTTMDPDMVLISGPHLDVTLAPGCSPIHLDQHDPQDSKALGHKPGSRWWPRTLALALAPVVSGATTVNTDSGCSRTMDPDMALSSNPGPDDTMTSVATGAPQIGVGLVPTLDLGHQPWSR
ncbi:hypothetical protein STEG23_000795 [Scotinomys teguina]